MKTADNFYKHLRPSVEEANRDSGYYWIKWRGHWTVAFWGIGYDYKYWHIGLHSTTIRGDETLSIEVNENKILPPK